MNDELVLEGLAREVVNRIQRSRRDQRLNVSDRVILTVSASEHLDDAIFTHKDYIMKETLATSIQRGNGNEKLTFMIDDHKLGLTIEKAKL